MQLLSNVPVTELLASNSLEDCLKLIEYIKKPEKDILTWLIDLLCQVVKNEGVNKMNRFELFYK